MHVSRLAEPFFDEATEDGPLSADRSRTGFRHVWQSGCPTDV